MLNKNIDILFISEMKLDASFTSGQCKIKRFTTPYRFETNDKGCLSEKRFNHVCSNKNSTLS